MKLRMTGFSKEGKHQHPQIYLGLLVGENGYPIGYNIFEGNIYEGHTLIPMLESFEKRFKLDKPVVVADSGLLSKSNIKSLKAKNYTFILGARIKNESKKVITEIENLNLKNAEAAEIEKEDNTRLIISYSEKRPQRTN
jgi:transposase